MYILENKQDGSYFGAKSFYIKSEFTTEAAAKAAKTRYTKKYADVFVADNFKVTDLNDYVEPQITRTKSFPGTGETKTYTIGINSIGTCTDPATETYWSM
tara:strand:- start:170 stop:469 length:300 start_codon:yes stop_codon:yes gene_type:complete